MAQEGGGGGRAAVGAVHNNSLFVDVRAVLPMSGFDGAHKHPNLLTGLWYKPFPHMHMLLYVIAFICTDQIHTCSASCMYVILVKLIIAAQNSVCFTLSQSNPGQ